MRKDSCLLVSAAASVLCHSTLKCQPASDSPGLGVALFCSDALDVRRR